MQGIEQDTILVLCDISGYTRFMLDNRTALAHAQVIITELISAIVKAVEIPLKISKLEGDAVFLYAIDDSSKSVSKVVGARLVRFFDSFSHKLDEISGSHLCKCGACANIHHLKLKVLVHHGRALFFTIGEFDELSGPDVILAHRLLKNKLKAKEYLLLTEPALSAVHIPFELSLKPHVEHYEGFEKTTVHYAIPPFEGDRGVPIRSEKTPTMKRIGVGWKMLSGSLTLALGLGKKEFRNLPKRKDR